MEDLHYFENLPKKRMAAGVIFFDVNKNILVVKPTYKDTWTIPGGVTEENESPSETCIREVKEELGLEIKTLEFLVVDYMSPEKSEYKNKTENLQFIFYGGILPPEKIHSIRIPKDELSEFSFIPVKKVLTLLNKNLARRVPHALTALEKRTSFYLENGNPIIVT